mmetsp:Transcript_6317/g.17595  ORF Transcript_6317/g.17595 Transcript_6317/m.17595 type:complete len:141 (-) Transcript_6317:52-474(-)
MMTQSGRSKWEARPSALYSGGGCWCSSHCHFLLPQVRWWPRRRCFTSSLPCFTASSTHLRKAFQGVLLRSKLLVKSITENLVSPSVVSSREIQGDSFLEEEFHGAFDGRYAPWIDIADRILITFVCIEVWGPAEQSSVCD